MAEININNLEGYDFKNAQKGDIVFVATINYGELQSFTLHPVKSVSPKKGYVTLDNDLKYSKDGYEYGRGSFSRISHQVLVDSEEVRKMANSYMAQKNTARNIITQLQKINMERLMKTTSTNCRRLSLILSEILEGGN